MRLRRVLSSTIFLISLGFPAVFGQESSESGEIGRLLVGYEHGQQKAKVLAELVADGADVQAFLDSIDVAVVRVSEKHRVRLWEALVRGRKYRFVEPDYVAQSLATPNDPHVPSQWHLSRIQALAAWDLTKGAASTRIAVLDSGLDSTHEDIAPKAQPGWSYLTGTSDASDVQGHGTKVAGAAAAATNNSIGVAGVGWANPIVPYVIMNSSGSAYYSHVASAIMAAADAGIRVISISLAGSNASATLDNAVSYAWSKGAVVFAAAGNYSSTTRYYPAACPYAIAVGATDSADNKSSYSNYGSWVTLFAPGDSILTTANGGGYVYSSGTSFATPITAGVAALVLSKNPSLTASQLVELLKQNTDDLGDPGFDSVFSWGRINAYKAVSAAGGPPPPDTTPPTVSITSPAAGSTVSGTVAVSATATDNIGVTKVEFWAGLSLVGSDTSAPYSINWNTSSFSGAVTLSAKAYDAAGNVGTSTVTLAVEAIADKSPPIVTITSPAAGSTLSGTVTINADASDNVGVTKVEFWVGSTLLGTDTTAPYSATWNTSTYSGSLTLAARAFDAAGNIGNASINLNVSAASVDTKPPTVSFTSPAAGSVIRSNTTVTATASDDTGVTKVEFYVGSGLVAVDTAPPYSFVLNPTLYPEGTLTMTARAYDAAGNIGQASRSVSNQPNVRGKKRGKSSITSPADGATLAGVVTIQANALFEGPVGRIDFYANAMKIGTRNAPPFSIAWDTKKVPDGVYRLTVVAYDTTGDEDLSEAVVIKVGNSYNPAADTLAPVVAFASPSDGATVSGFVSVQVAAADNVGVTKVELWVDNRLSGTRTAAPYSFTWNSGETKGTARLSAKAFDAAGNTAVASITVKPR